MSTSLERAARAELESGGLLGVPSEPGQLDLLRDTDGNLPANVFQIARQQAARGVGRPAGSVNKRSLGLAKLVAQQAGDPVLFMASLYRMPLDQMTELLLAADGSLERQIKIGEAVEGLAKEIRRKLDGGEMGSIQLLAEAASSLEHAANRVGKPGDLAIKALNLQLAAAKSVSEYVHSKKAVEANVTLKTDGVLFMPSPGGGSLDGKAEDMARASEIVAAALARGDVRPEDFARLKLIDNQFVDAEFEDVEPIDEDAIDGDDGE